MLHKIKRDIGCIVEVLCEVGYGLLLEWLARIGLAPIRDTSVLINALSITLTEQAEMLAAAEKELTIFRSEDARLARSIASALAIRAGQWRDRDTVTVAMEFDMPRQVLSGTERALLAEIAAEIIAGSLMENPEWGSVEMAEAG